MDGSLDRSLQGDSIEEEISITLTGADDETVRVPKVKRSSQKKVKGDDKKVSMNIEISGLFVVVVVLFPLLM